MKSVALLASCTLVLVACGETVEPVAPRAARPNAAVVLNDGRQPFSASLFNACTGEVIDLTGWTRTTATETVDGAGGTHVTVHSTIALTGVGQTTGAEYVANQSFTNVVRGPLPSGDVTVLTQEFIAKGTTTADRFITLRARLLVNAEGEVVLDSFDSQVTCR